MPPKTKIVAPKSEKRKIIKPVFAKKEKDSDIPEETVEGDESIEEILKSIDFKALGSDANNLTEEEIHNITSIKYVNFDSMHVVTTLDKSLLYEVLWFYMQYGYESLYSFLIELSKSDKIVQSNCIISTELFIMQKNAYIEKIEKLSAVYVVSEGIIPCNNCKSLNVITVAKQTRGGDEGATYYHKCTICGSQWSKNS